MSTYFVFITIILFLYRCSTGQDHFLFRLFDVCWPNLRASIRLYVDADDILKQYLTLLMLYAEHQLTRLPSTSCIALYQTTYEVLSIYHKRFALCEQRSEHADEEAVLFRNEACLHILELLNHLSSKDFSFTEDCAESINLSFEQEISAVLLHGLELIIPILSTENLHTFPTTAEKFYGFVAFVTSSYVVEMARWLNAKAGTEGARILHEIILRLHCGASAVDSAAARSALQVRWVFHCELFFQCFVPSKTSTSDVIHRMHVYRHYNPWRYISGSVALIRCPSRATFLSKPQTCWRR